MNTEAATTKKSKISLNQHDGDQDVYKPKYRDDIMRLLNTRMFSGEGGLETTLGEFKQFV